MTEILERSVARVRTIDFRAVPDHRQHASGINRDDPQLIKDSRPVNAEGKLLTKKQIRARARRRGQRNTKGELMTEQDFEALYKPIDEWDMEELARGRPRDKNGNFQGSKPKWITAKIHEEAMEKFSIMVRTEMSALNITALETLAWILQQDDVDNRGRPVVAAATKAQVAQFLLEHQVGKPKQQIQSDISIKLQGLLGTVLVNPNAALAPGDQGGMSQLGQPSAYQVGHLPGHTIPMGQIDQPDQSEIIELDEEDIVDDES